MLIMSCKKDGLFCDGESLVCRLNPEDAGKVYRELGDDVDRPFFNKVCSNFGEGFDFGGYEQNFSIDVSVLVPLNRRVLGACRCSVCSKSSLVRSCYVNDVLCRFDGGVCGGVDFSRDGDCCQRYKGHILHCSRFKSSVRRLV